MTIEPNALWRYKKMPNAIYEVVECKFSTVYYRIYDSCLPEKRTMIQPQDIWLRDYEPLSIDDALVETGGIF